MGSVELSELTFASLAQAAEAVREGRVTSLELTEHMVQRIERFNPALNAIVSETQGQ